MKIPNYISRKAGGHFPESTKSAFTLVEVIVSILILGLMSYGIVYSYIQSGKRATWSSYSLAAQALSIQQLEQARQASWDTKKTPVVDQIVLIPRISSAVLDIPVSGTNFVWATNYVTITTNTVSANPPVSLRMIRVDTVWRFPGGRLFTNSIATFRSPDV